MSDKVELSKYQQAVQHKLNTKMAEIKQTSKVEELNRARLEIVRQRNSVAFQRAQGKPPVVCHMCKACTTALSHLCTLVNGLPSVCTALAVLLVVFAEWLLSLFLLLLLLHPGRCPREIPGLVGRTPADGARTSSTPIPQFCVPTSCIMRPSDIGARVSSIGSLDLCCPVSRRLRSGHRD